MTSATLCQCFGCKSGTGAVRRVVLVCGGCAATIAETRRVGRNVTERENRRSRARPASRLCAADCGKRVWTSRARYCKDCSEQRAASQRRAYFAERRARAAAARPVAVCGCGAPVRLVVRGRAKFCESCAAARCAKPRVCLSPEQKREHDRRASSRSMAKLRANPAFRERERTATKERMRKRRARSKPTDQQEATR